MYTLREKSIDMNAHKVGRFTWRSPFQLKVSRSLGQQNGLFAKVHIGKAKANISAIKKCWGIK